MTNVPALNLLLVPAGRGKNEGQPDSIEKGQGVRKNDCAKQGQGILYQISRFWSRPLEAQQRRRPWANLELLNLILQGELVVDAG